MSDFLPIFQRLKSDYDETAARDTGEAYSRLSTIFEGLDSMFREHLQAMTLDEIKLVIRKLQGADALTEAELARVRLWIVGDAENYTRLENNVADWKAELARLVEEISRLATGNPDVETCSRLRGLLRDGVRVISDLMFFTQQKDRLQKFNEASQNLDAVDRQFLVRLLEQKIKSPDY